MGDDFCPPGQDRRAPLTEDRVRLMVADAIEAHEKKLVAHIDAKFDELHDLIKAAFPGGDPHGHRMAHEAQIEQAQGWKKLKSEIVSKFLIGGLLAAAVWLVHQGWQGFLHAVQGPIPPK